MSCRCIKGLRFLVFVARKRDEANRDDIANNHKAFFLLRQYLENLYLVLCTDRDDHAPTNRKLLDQRRRAGVTSDARNTPPTDAVRPKGERSESIHPLASTLNFCVCKFIP